MVTGDLFVNKVLIDNSYVTKDSNLYHLALHWDRHILRFLVINSNSNLAIAAGAFEKDDNTKPEEFLEKTFAQNELLSLEYKAVLLSYSGYKAALIPLSIYDFRQKGALLLSSKEIRETRHSKLSSVMLTEKSELDHWFISKFPEIKIHSNNSLLLESLIRKYQFEEKDILFLEICSNKVEVFLFNKGKFKLYNCNDWQHINDLLYHALNTSQLNEINTEKCKIILGGNVGSTETTTSLFKDYFWEVELAENYTNTGLSVDLAEINKAEFVSAFNLYTCAS